MEYFRWLTFIILILSLGSWMKGRRWFNKEVELNEIHEAPSDQQIRWHITHMREDMHMLVLSNYALTIAIIAILFLK